MSQSFILRQKPGFRSGFCCSAVAIQTKLLSFVRSLFSLACLHLSALLSCCWCRQSDQTDCRVPWQGLPLTPLVSASFYASFTPSFEYIHVSGPFYCISPENTYSIYYCNTNLLLVLSTGKQKKIIFH